MLDWWFASRLEGDQYVVAEQQGCELYQASLFEKGKCNKGSLFPIHSMN
jgi:hypothetical protein